MPTDPRDQPNFEQRLRVMQILAAALCLGVVVFGMVAVVVAQGRQPSDGLVAYLGVGFAAILVVMRFVVPGLIVSQMPAPGQGTTTPEAGGSQSPGNTLSVYQTKMIIELAILEGAAFFNLVAYIVEVQTFSLIIAAALLFLMLTSFPSRGKVEQWLEGNGQIADWAAASDESSAR